MDRIQPQLYEPRVSQVRNLQIPNLLSQSPYKPYFLPLEPTHLYKYLYIRAVLSSAYCKETRLVPASMCKRHEPCSRRSRERSPPGQLQNLSIRQLHLRLLE